MHTAHTCARTHALYTYTHMLLPEQWHMGPAVTWEAGFGWFLYVLVCDMTHLLSEWG